MVEHETAPIDDCWNRIGVQGDMSCPRLREHIHCRNCPVYATAARRLLDRHPATFDDTESGQPADAQVQRGIGNGHAVAPDALNSAGTLDATGATGAASASAHLDNAATLSALVFRLGAEWLALPTATLAEVATMRAIHTLPRRSGVVTGVCNIRGRLLVCISLPVLLGLTTQTAPSATPTAFAPAAKAQPRLLIINSAPRAVVVPVDEVEGIRAYAADALGPVPATLGTERYTSAIARHGERTIGVLDGNRLLQAIDRSLT